MKVVGLALFCKLILIKKLPGNLKRRTAEQCRTAERRTAELQNAEQQQNAEHMFWEQIFGEHITEQTNDAEYLFFNFVLRLRKS